MWGRDTGSTKESTASTIPEVQSVPAPMLGEHTCAVLLDAGYTEEEVGHLLGTGVLVSSDPRKGL